MLTFDKDKLYMPDMYDDAIRRGGDNTFIFYQKFDGSTVEYSYNYISKQSNLLTEKLEKAGLEKGDVVAVVSSLRPWWYALAYTCFKKGYIMSCIDPGVPASSMEDLILQSDVRAVFTSIPKVFLPEELEGIIPVYEINEGFPLLNNCEQVNLLLNRSKKLPDNTDYILFSSGTTSENRKAVLLSNSTITIAMDSAMSNDNGIYKHETAYNINKRDLVLFPPYHIAGLICVNYDLYCNTQVIMLERLTPNLLMSTLKNLKPDNICTVPSMLTALYKKIVTEYSKKLHTKVVVNTLLKLCGFLRHRLGIKAGRVLLKSLNKKAFGGNMKGFMIGASPFDETANKFFLDMGIDVIMAYGLTELGAPLTCTGKGYYPGTAGRSLRHRKDHDVRIVNKDSNGRGEVEVLCPFRMISYMNEEDNIGCFTEDGYFKTGDLGYFNSDKCLIINGRIKETIVLRNGEKLLPEEIENKYQNVDCVKDLVAFKIPGEANCDDFAIAIIKDREKAIPDEAMKKRIYERADGLPQMYRPKDVYVLREFPLSSSHKVQRFRLTEMVNEGKDAPITDSSKILVDEDETSAALRQMLINVGGPSWKTVILTQGLLLNLDSLSTVDLYVAIQGRWNIDLFQSSVQPETFGDLLDIVKNFEKVDKRVKKDVDLSKYPLPVSKLGRITSKAVLTLFKNAFHVKCDGLENIPKDRSFILCSNHRTVFDPAFILSCFNSKLNRKTCVIGKVELATDKLLSKFVKTQNFIPVDRTGNSIKTLERCSELLQEGYNILIFPEGTNLQNNTTMMPLKNGAAKLAIATNKDIVPLRISGVAHYEGETKNFDIPSMKSKIHISFGKPISSKGLSVDELNELIKIKIEELDSYD